MQKVLFERFNYNSKPSVYLNKKRKSIRNLIQNKLDENIYINEIINCHVCDSTYDKHTLISKKERHGIELDCVICNDCVLVFTNPRMSQESYNNFYTNYYRDLYNYEIGDRNLKNLFLDNYNNGQKVFEFVKNFIKPESKVLEIGCANGGLLKYFEEKNFQVTGLDLGKDEIDYGKKNYGLNLFHSSIEDFHSKNKQDLIIMIHVIEHLTDCRTTMREIRNNLTDEGYLYISCPDTDILSNGLIYKSDWITLMQNAHTINFNRVSVSNLLNKYGFEICHFEPGMNLIARKTALEKSYVNNFTNTLESIINAENIYQSRKIKNKIRQFLEVNGLFAFLIFIFRPLNIFLLKIGMQKYIKNFLKKIYRFI